MFCRWKCRFAVLRAPMQLLHGPPRSRARPRRGKSQALPQGTPPKPRVEPKPLGPGDEGFGMSQIAVFFFQADRKSAQRSATKKPSSAAIDPNNTYLTNRSQNPGPPLFSSEKLLLLWSNESNAKSLLQPSLQHLPLSKRPAPRHDRGHRHCDGWVHGSAALQVQGVAS